jgi:hypothetical protein
MKKSIVLLIFSLSSFLSIGQCKYQKITRPDGTTVIQYETLPVAVSNNNEIGFSIGSNLEDVFLAMTVRFKGMQPSKIKNSLTIFLKNSYQSKQQLILNPYDQQFASIGNETVLQIIFKLSKASQAYLIEYILSSFNFQFSINPNNETIRTFQVGRNADIIQQQLLHFRHEYGINENHSEWLPNNQNRQTNYETSNRTNNQTGNSIYIGETSYPSTSTWTFSNDYFLKTLNVTVAIHPTTGGFLMLETSTSFPQEKISGTILLYLANNTVIKCIDRGIKDHVNGKSIALYKFTEEEMKKLAQNRITSIRFSARSNFSSDSYIVKNVKSMLDKLSSPNSEDYYETDKEIKDLF